MKDNSTRTELKGLVDIIIRMAPLTQAISLEASSKALAFNTQTLMTWNKYNPLDIGTLASSRNSSSKSLNKMLTPPNSTFHTKTTRYRRYYSIYDYYLYSIINKHIYILLLMCIFISLFIKYKLVWIQNNNRKWCGVDLTFQ